MTVEPTVEVSGAATVESAADGTDDAAPADVEDWSVLEGAAEFWLHDTRRVSAAMAARVRGFAEGFFILSVCVKPRCVTRARTAGEAVSRNGVNNDHGGAVCLGSASRHSRRRTGEHRGEASV